MRKTFNSLSFDLISDEHTDRQKTKLDYKAIKTPGCDLALVLGDISNGGRNSLDVIAEIAGAYEHVVFTYGNNELWPEIRRGEVFSFERIEDELEEGAKAIGNATFLDRGYYLRNGVAIIGGYGSWDYESGAPEVSAAEGRRKNMEWISRNSTADPEQMTGAMIDKAHKDAERLGAEVSVISHDLPEVHSIVVATHVVPDPRVLAPPPANSRHDNSLMGNFNLVSVRDRDTQGKIKCFAFGHQHKLVDTVKDGIRYVAHPRGEERDNLDPVGYRPKNITVAQWHAALR